MTKADASAQRREPVDRAQLGAQIRERRRRGSLTLQELSALSGVSRAALSKVERGEMSPTYETLCKIAKGLRIGLVDLISPQRQPAPGGDVQVTRRGAGVVFETGVCEHQILAGEERGRPINAFLSEVLARDVAEYDALDTHERADFIHVLSGRIRLFYGDEEPIDLGPHDSASFDGRRPHAVISRSRENARVLWVDTRI